MGDNIISTNKLSITLGKKKILKDITFEVKEKEIVNNSNEKFNFLLEGDNLHSLYLLEKQRQLNC